MMISTAGYKHIQVDHHPAVTYVPPVGEGVSVLLTEADDCWDFMMVDIPNMEVLEFDQYDTLEEALDELDRRFGKINKKRKE